MSATLQSVLAPKRTFTYEYDLGTTTPLKGRMIGWAEGVASRPSVRIVAQNDPPDIRCEECSAAATWVSTWDDRGFLCSPCADVEDDLGVAFDSGFLPVVNSPRVGQCGYVG